MGVVIFYLLLVWLSEPIAFDVVHLVWAMIFSFFID